MAKPAAQRMREYRARNRKVLTVTCASCGGEFGALRSTAKYCTDACRQDARVKRIVTALEEERGYCDIELRERPEWIVALHPYANYPRCTVTI